MEIQSGNALQDTIHNIYTLSKGEEKVNFQALLTQVEHLVNLFCDHELSSPGGKLSSTDYQLFLLTHLISLDTINARYLWKRIPKGLKPTEGTQIAPETQALIDIWEVGKELTKKEYAQAFKLINSYIAKLQQDAEKNGGSTLKLLEVLHLTLRDHHLVKIVSKAYSTIEFQQAKLLFGFTTEDSDRSVQEFFSKKGLQVEGGFVYLPADSEQDASAKRFTLDEERVSQLAQVVQFLEQ